MIDLSGFAQALAAQTVASEETALLAELERDWTTRTAPDWMASYAAHCPFDGVPSGAYGWRWISDSELGDVLAGIHFRGMDGSHPFVGVRCWTRPERARLAALGDLLAREWAAFRPRSFRLFRAAATWTPHGRVDQHLLAGRLDAIRARPHPPATGRVHLRAGEPEPLVARVAELFEAVFAARPELRHRIEPATADDLETCAKDQALFEVLVDGRPAGVVAARRARRLAWSGAEMVEEVLDPALWGGGLGVALQRALADAIPDSLGPFLWGTIDGTNEASLRTAQRVGRTIAGSWWFVPLE